MPHAPKIRKDIRHVLDKYVIPALSNGPVLQVLAKPPFRFSAAPHWRSMKISISTANELMNSSN